MDAGLSHVPGRTRGRIDDACSDGTFTGLRDQVGQGVEQRLLVHIGGTREEAFKELHVLLRHRPLSIRAVAWGVARLRKSKLRGSGITTRAGSGVKLQMEPEKAANSGFSSRLAVA